MALSTQRASSSALEWKYDVFLSFRGEDTRNGFTAHLYDKLRCHGIETFLDNTQLQIGKPISDLFLAIEQSRFAIVVMSQNYASSTWCLNEIVKILECMDARGAVIPIFYYVQPSHVGKQLGSFAEAFTKLEERFKDDTEKVERWKAALRKFSVLKGHKLTNDRPEPEVIKEIVDEVRSKTRPILLESAEKLIGIESRLKQLDLLLDTESNSDVRFIGIWGMRGVGKTTIAKIAYERMLHKFDASSFLDRVREVSKTEGGLANLQRKLSMNLMNRNIEDWNIHEEVTMRNFLLQKKILLILDDVDHISQLENLCRSPNCFGPGSRIIITTTDEHLLITHGIERRLKELELNEDDALELFSWKAFKKDYPDNNYIDLSKSFVSYANGLPLALKVLGSLLHGRDQDAWRSKLDKLEHSFNGEIMDTLKVSYDGLDEQERSIFLDIACFFKGKYKDRVVELLESCGFHPGIDIDVLIKRSLIKISDNIVWMHDLLEEMGRAIVRQQSQEPGERSRLWFSRDIFHVLRENTGTAAVEVIVLDSLESKEAQCHPEAFSKMFNLRLLKLHNLHLPEGLKHLPNSLRFLEWRGYPLQYFPPSFEPDELVELSMCHSSIEQLWNGIKNFEKLKIITLSHSKNLTRTPDFGGVQNLEKLHLEGCESLVVVHPSLGLLKKLTFLTLKDCKNLESLPGEIEMEGLEILILSGCSSVKEIPRFVEPLEHLWKLCLDGTAIESIPSSIEHLTSLSSLDLRDCVNLNCLPITIGNLTSLKLLNVFGCSKLTKFPETIGRLECLEKIDLSGTSIKGWPSSSVLKNLKSYYFRGPKGPSRLQLYMSLSWLIPMSMHPISSFVPPLSGLCSLRELDLSDGNLWDGAIPGDIGCLSSLVSLNLSGNNFHSLPNSISGLSKLESLYLSRCRKLQQLPVLSSYKNLEVTADGCTSLEMLQYPSNMDRLNCSFFNFINCFELADKENYNHIITTLLQSFFKEVPYPGDRFEIVIPGGGIPWLFNHRIRGSLACIELARDWNNSKWLGFALCAVFQVFGSGWEVSCVLEVNEREQYPAPLLSTDVQPVSDHIWLLYVSRDISFGTEWQNNCNQLIFSFKSSGPCFVKECGVRLVYEQDVEEFNMVSAKFRPNLPIYERDREEFSKLVPKSKSRSNISIYEVTDLRHPFPRLSQSEVDLVGGRDMKNGNFLSFYRILIFVILYFIVLVCFIIATVPNNRLKCQANEEFDPHGLKN